MRGRAGWLAVVVLASAGTAAAWWDTQVQVVRLPPSVATWQAEDAQGLTPQDIAADAAAWGGRAVALRPGGAVLSFEYDCRVSHYMVFVVCRVDEADLQEVSPVILRLRVTDLTRNRTREWRQRITYEQRYEDSAHLYFPVYEPGPMRIEIFSDRRSQRPLLVDYLALKDIFGELPCTGEKHGQNLHTPEEMKAIRANPENLRLAVKLLEDGARQGLTPADAAKVAEWRRARFEEVWGAVPPRNLHFGGPAGPPPRDPKGDTSAADYAAKLMQQAGGVAAWRLKPGWGPWTFVHPKTGATYTLENWQRGEAAGDCAFPDDGTGFYASKAQTGGVPLQLNWMGAAVMGRFQELRKLASQRADEYLKTGNEIAGWEGACALLAFIEMYPDIDYQTQRFEFGHTMFDMNPYGKFVYSGWAIDIIDMVQAYDALFPLIQGNAELATLVGRRIPWVQRPEDVIKLADTNLLQHIRDCVDRLVIRAGDGDSEKVMAVAALVQGPGRASEWMFDLLFTRCHFRMVNRGGLQDHLTSSYNRDGSNYIASVEYSKASSAAAAAFAEVCRRYKQLGGKLRFDISDGAKYPKIAEAPYFVMNRKVAGGFVPRIGEWGMASDPPELKTDRTFRPLYLYGFLAHGDPRFAWLVRDLGREGESDEVWARIDAAAATVDRAPFLMSGSRSMPGFGMHVLEAGTEQTDRRKKTAVVLRTGVGQGHGHFDQLGIIFYARGCRALTDNGRRGGNPDARGSKVHNLVEVDEKNFMPVAMARTGVGWAEAFKNLGDSGYMAASARSASHPYLKTYRREVALIGAGEGDAYLADVFRVDGGKVHTWCCAGPVCSEPAQLQLSVPMQTGQEGLLKSYLRENFTYRAIGTATDSLVMTWRMDPGAVQRYLGGGKDVPDVHVRAWHLGAAGRPVMHAWAKLSDYTGQGTPHNYVFVRNEGQEGLQGAYVTVSEAYDGDQSLVRSAEFERLRSGGATGAGMPVALKVRARGGQDDMVIFGGASTLRTESDIRMQGQFALMSAGEDGLRKVALVGGSFLEWNGLVIRPETARYAASVKEVDVASNAVRLDRPLPAKVLAGATFLVERPNADHHESYIVSSVAGDVVKLRGAMPVFLTAVTQVDERTGEVVTEMEPTLLESSRTYYDGLPVVNEAGRVLGRAEVRRGDRWMYLGFPEALRWAQKISMAEIVDADGDGRRTLRMIATGKQNRRNPDGSVTVVNPGERMVDLEVTRVSEDGYTLWYKEAPEQFLDAIAVVHEAWPYDRQKLVTEDGKRTLRSVYPGRDVKIAVKDRKATWADFPDADGDGRRCLMICDIMPGDNFGAPTHVVMDRVAKDVWKVSADCGVTLRLPGKAEATLVRKAGGQRETRRLTAGPEGFALPVETFADAEAFLVASEDPAALRSVP